MRIFLARHGQPDCLSLGNVAPRDMSKWIQAYNDAGVLLDDVPPQAIETARSSGIVVASTMRRAVHSAQYLSGSQAFLAEHVFCEAGLPHPCWHFPKLPPSAWATIFRLAWFLGYAANAESIESATARAGAAAERLVQLAKENGSVFLVGHGIMTMLIAKHLLSLGWVGPSRPSHGYWQFSTYRAAV